jgi:diguanylate cyclase (GGDEF)-like protein/hemerythrin-like metal-binding protein
MKNIKQIFMLFLVITTIIITFTSKYNSLIKEFENTGKSKQTALNDDIRLSSNFIEDATLYGNNFFQHSKIKDSPLYSLLKYNPISNSYNLDAVGGTEYIKNTGNLTGIGIIPENDFVSDEINLALYYNEFFNKFYTKRTDIACLKYTSENNFVNVYPWISSREFTFTEDQKNSEFYIYANPENNPLRKVVWTPVYLDPSGKGLIVTLSSPIYDNDTFKGVASVDFATKNLSEIINSDYESFLIDDTSSVIAANRVIDSDKKVTKLDTLINDSENNIKKMKESKKISVQRVGTYYVYTGGFTDVDWKILLIVPMYLLIAKSIFFTLPSLAICILLFFSANEIVNRKKTEEVLKKIAITDQLTGLNNRHFFDERLLIEMNRSDRYNRPLSMIIFDLDHFKRINDTWGHPIGDEVLKQTAEITSSLIRNTDLVFRFGGEEFVILLPETTLSNAQIVAEKLRDALDKNMHPFVGKYTASFGVGERLKDESFKTWYQKVDNALYSAKNDGRNSVATSLEQDFEAISTVYIKWQSEWASGDYEIDEQHKKLIQATNELLDMSFSVIYSDKIIKHFDILIEYLINHFAYEEKIIFDNGYPDFENHIRVHKNLVEKILQFKNNFHSGNFEYLDFFEILVNDIIIGHIINEDINYFPYISKN